MKIKTNTKAGGIDWNHNQTLRVKSAVKADAIVLHDRRGN